MILSKHIGIEQSVETSCCVSTIPKKCEKNQKKQVLTKKFKEKLCWRECKFANPKEAVEDKKRLLMFIGNKGTGVRSRIKSIGGMVALCDTWKKHQRLHHQ
jgi:hypothetical protein